MTENKFRINDIVKIVYDPDCDLPIPDEYKINIWRIVLFPDDGDEAAIIENLASKAQTFVPTKELVLQDSINEEGLCDGFKARKT